MKRIATGCIGMALLLFLGMQDVAAETEKEVQAFRRLSDGGLTVQAEMVDLSELLWANADVDGAKPSWQAATQTLFLEDFEGGMDPGWMLLDQNSDSGYDYWGAVTCHLTPHGGSYVGWCAAYGRTACSTYDNNMQSWMVYGPFSLENCTQASVDFYMASQTEAGWDGIYWLASTDGGSFTGYGTDGTTSGYPYSWVPIHFDLTDIGSTHLNLCGQPQVWIAFYFESDASYSYGGTYLDDIAVNVDGGTGTGEIRGSKWNDGNGNGTWDAGEPGLEGWWIFADVNDNGTWEPGEPNAVTDTNGDYALRNLPPATYIVMEVQQDEWQQTYPGGPGQALQRTLAGGKSTYYDLLTDEQKEDLEIMIMDSPPLPPAGLEHTRVNLQALPQNAKILSEVPTSTWTYGCSATSAGMMFGYYDRTGYPNMYTGTVNGGVCPLDDLGQGDNPAYPIPGACSIIATQQGFDGRAIRGHVDDYWIGYNIGGPDPFEGAWTEHTWGDCTADYMGTNQWKWDYDLNGARESNSDGATTLWTNSGGGKLYDLIPGSEYGSPQTALCHGLRLFAESRGYTVVENYTQKVDAVATGGFTFQDFRNEIDAGRPVMIQVTGHSMAGVGYDETSQTIYIHDTWDNSVHSMPWGGSYADMDHQAVTVVVLAPAGTPYAHTVVVEAGQVVENIDFGNRRQQCGDWGYPPADLNQDCYVSLADLAIMAAQWLHCSDPQDPSCTNYLAPGK